MQALSVNNQVLLAQAKVGNDASLQLTPMPGGLTAPLTTGLNTSQLALLNNQRVLLLMDKQVAQVFLTSSIASHTLTLTPAVAAQLRQWLMQNRQFDVQNLPSDLADLFSKELSKELGIQLSNVLNRLTKIQLHQQALTLQLLTQAPVLEIALKGQPQSADTESLSQLLQFIIPIAFNDDATVLVREKPNKDASGDHNMDQSSPLMFDMQFDLETLGRLTISIALSEFSLRTECKCSRPELLEKTQRLWPLLQSRLERLGFDCQNQVFLERTDEPKRLARHQGLVSIKV